jgi:hypothetical protein
VATVIQEQQRSHDDRPPRWERTPRAALCEPYRALPAQGLALRQAAQALAVPRSTLQAWRAHQDRLDEQPAVVAFFPRAPGRACLHRLGLGVPLVCTAVGACGIRLGCRRVQRTGLDRFVAASYGAPPQGNRQGEEAIVAYRREASARVAQAMPAPALTVAKDATSPGGLCLGAMAPKSHDLLVEQAAPARAQDTWQARLAPALSGLHCQGIPSPRDAAPGLLA